MKKVLCSSFKKVFYLLVLSPILLGINGGCLGNVGPTPVTSDQYFQRYEPILRLAVQVAVLNFLEKNPSYTTRVDKFSEYMLDYLDKEHETIDLATLEKVAREKIDWSRFDSTEKLLVEALISTIRGELERVVTANVGEVTPPEKVTLYSKKFLTWVKTAAETFSPQRKNTVPVLSP